MATIRQRGSYWEARVRRRGWPTLSRSFPTKSDARAWATVIESEMERGIYIDRTEAEKNTLGDLLQRSAVEVSSQKKAGSRNGTGLLPFFGIRSPRRRLPPCLGSSRRSGGTSASKRCQARRPTGT
uniref:Integrase n=1 Tax=Ralstonia solanacearum TaxID=305 RepID=A0A0S4VUS5_RALSL|nr:protein of unknown function [Ralstonia solanacearum]CUV38310.1 protein of unknown function [Ralstonia solanacearum]CUV59988.1 protein of unknown function [Ralstonia solanacearum]